MSLYGSGPGSSKAGGAKGNDGRGGGRGKGKNGNVDGGGGDKRRSSGVMSVATWNKLSPQEKGNLFGGTRPGSQKKAKKQQERGSRYD
jgi:hypothetical protein